MSEASSEKNMLASKYANGLWFAALVGLWWLALVAPKPGCKTLRDENGKVVLYACGFVGGGLGPALFLVCATVPFLLTPVAASGGRISLAGLTKSIALVGAALFYARWDVKALGPSGIAWFVSRCWGGMIVVMAVTTLADIFLYAARARGPCTLCMAKASMPQHTKTTENS